MLSALLFWYFFSAWHSSAWNSAPLGRLGGVLGLPQYETVLNSSQVLKLSGKEKEKVLSVVKKAPVSVVW